MSRVAIADTGPLVAFLDRAERHHAWAAECVGELAAPLLVCEPVLALRTLQSKYRDRPMSLADACIVRMAELFEQHQVLTLDADFSIYRKHGREPLALIQPRT